MPASSDETVVGPFFHPNSPLYLWLPIPCSNIWLFLLFSAYIAQVGHELALYPRTNLDFWSSERESMWQRSPGEGSERSACKLLWRAMELQAVHGVFAVIWCCSGQWQSVKDPLGHEAGRHWGGWFCTSLSGVSKPFLLTVLSSELFCPIISPTSREGLRIVEPGRQKPWQETSCLLGGVRAPCEVYPPHWAIYSLAQVTSFPIKPHD